MKNVFAVILFFTSASWAWAESPNTATENTAANASQPAATPDTAAPAADTANQTTAAPQPEQTETQAADTQTPTASPATAAADTQAGFSRGSVVRSIFTSAIEDREPVDKLENSLSDNDRVFYFTELRDMSGQTAIHRWEYDGEVIAEVKFDVRGPRWRVWSSKSFIPAWTGDWKVSVLNGAGETISEDIISLQSIAAAATAAPAELTNEPAPAQEPASAQPAAAPALPAAQPAQ